MMIIPLIRKNRSLENLLKNNEPLGYKKPDEIKNKIKSIIDQINIYKNIKKSIAFVEKYFSETTKNEYIKKLNDLISEYNEKARQYNISIDSLNKNYNETLQIINYIYENIKNYDDNTLTRIDNELFNQLEPIKIDDFTKENIKILKNNNKIFEIQAKTREQIKKYKDYNKIGFIPQNNCKRVFNIDFEKQIDEFTSEDLNVELDDLEINKLIKIQNNIKKHTDDIIELYQNIDSMGKRPMKDIDDLDITFSTNLLKQYVDKQILKGENIKDIRRDFFKKIRKTQKIIKIIII